MYIAIRPVPKPRLTQRDRWAQRPAVVRYHAFCDELRLKSANYRLPAALKLTFYIEMPKSWSQKKRAAFADYGIHQQRPDIDNLSKAVMDALCEDDSYIFSLYATKFWAEEAGIEIEEIPVI